MIPGAVYLPVPSGEPAKSFRHYRRVIDALIRIDRGRPLVLVAVGGGSTGDLGGFAAATYRRGIPYIQMPTTLLAMVDASIGGKTGINHPGAKNMIGAIWQPSVVLADLDRLTTLPARQLASGLVEVVKHALIRDSDFFDRLERDALSRRAIYDVRGGLLRDSVVRSVEIKGAVVAKDARETKGVREELNLGHTLGHAIEAVCGYRGVTHGEAVTVGIIAALRISEGRFGFRGCDRVEAVFSALGFPTRIMEGRGLTPKRLLEATRLDKKRRTGALRMTLLKSIGKAVIVDGITDREFRDVCSALIPSPGRP